MVTRLGNAPSRQSAQGPGVPPHNLEAEESVLGACLLSREAIAVVLEILTPEDFYKPAHVEIFRAFLDLYGRGEPIDAVTVVEELRRRGSLEQVGAQPYIFTLVQAVPTPGSASHYARIVADHAVLRRLIQASHAISEMAYGVPEDVEEAIDFSEDVIYKVSQRRDSADFSPLRDLLTENMELVEKLYEAGSSITGLPSGFTELDNITAGFQPSNLIVVAGRPGSGKSALAVSVAQHVAVEARQPVVIFSLEMSKMELTQRLICAEARVDSNRIRRGQLQDNDWPKISHALGRLADAPIYIDDSGHVTIMEMRAKCRRLKAKHGLGLVIVDYLQLMQPHPGKRSDNRVQEVADISRSLKILARELDIPVIAVSQLSRNVEHRTDKRPVLADLRDSGCLTADTRIQRADTGHWVTMGELFESGERDIPVWSLDDKLKTVRQTMSHVFSSGVKKVYKMRLRSGKEIKASANHPFLRIDGWTRLDELKPGDRLATPRSLPTPLATTDWADEQVILLAHLIGDGCFVERQPLHYTNNDPRNLDVVESSAKYFGVTARRVAQSTWWHTYLPAPYHLTHGKRNPIAAWLDGLGLWGKRSREKFLPQEVFGLSDEQLALFIRHLWATDGHLSLRDRQMPALYYASGSRRLVEDVQLLLLRFDIKSVIRSMPKKGYLPTFGLWIDNRDSQVEFLTKIGIHGRRGDQINQLLEILVARKSNTNIDTIPKEVWDRVKDKLKEREITRRQFAAALGVVHNGSAAFRYSPSRTKLQSVAAVLEDEGLETLANSDVFWDEVMSIEYVGEESVYDATVWGTHNFLANGVFAHNSIEQDSDIVIFIYRDEVYNIDSPQKGIAEIHVAKHRNGPIGQIDLAFLGHYTKFANLARG